MIHTCALPPAPNVGVFWHECLKSFLKRGDGRRSGATAFSLKMIVFAD